MELKPQKLDITIISTYVNNNLKTKNAHRHTKRTSYNKNRSSHTSKSLIWRQHWSYIKCRSQLQAMVLVILLAVRYYFHKLFTLQAAFGQSTQSECLSVPVGSTVVTIYKVCCHLDQVMWETVYAIHVQHHMSPKQKQTERRKKGWSSILWHLKFQHLDSHVWLNSGKLHQPQPKTVI